MYRMHKFNRTINIIGKDMYKVDIQGSVAYAKGLARAGILNAHEESEMIRGLKLVEEEWDQGVVSLTVEKGSDISLTSKTTMRISLPQMKGD
jgi:argininosuccinate lyase